MFGIVWLDGQTILSIFVGFIIIVAVINRIHGKVINFKNKNNVEGDN